MVVYYQHANCQAEKNWFTIVNVKVTVRAYISKIWLFLLYLPNHWSICHQTQFDSTALLARVFCGKIGLLHSRSRSHWRLKMSVNICLDDIFWTMKHFVTKLGVVMLQNEPQCHVKQKLFAVFKVKVTARAHIIKILLWLQYLLNCWFLGNQTWSDDRLS